MTPIRDLTDEEWQCVAPLLPETRPRTELRGRPLVNTRAVLNGVLWVICSGATWAAMPRRYPSYQTCHRRFKIWHDAGVLRQVLCMLYGEAGDNLSYVLGARMRKHVRSKAAAARGMRVPAPVFLPAEPMVVEPVVAYGCLIQVCDRPSSDTPM